MCLELELQRIVRAGVLGRLVDAGLLLLIGRHLVHHSGPLRNVEDLLLRLVVAILLVDVVFDETVGLAADTEPCHLA